MSLLARDSLHQHAECVNNFHYLIEDRSLLTLVDCSLLLFYMLNLHFYDLIGNMNSLVGIDLAI